MCFHIKSDGWQCFHYVSSSSPHSDFWGQRWLDHLQLSTQWAIVGRSSHKLDLVKAGSKALLNTTTSHSEKTCLCLLISSSFCLSSRSVSLWAGDVLRDLKSAEEDVMGARQFIWGQTWCQWGSSSYEQTTAYSLCVCFIVYVCEVAYPFLSVCMYIVCMGCLIQLRRCAGGSPDALSWGKY